MDRGLGVGWTTGIWPVDTGEPIQAEHFGDLAAAINERRAIVSAPAPTAIGSGDRLTAAAIATYQASVDGLIGASSPGFVDHRDWSSADPPAWTRSGILTYIYNVLRPAWVDPADYGARTNWTRRPARLGSRLEGTLTAGDVLVREQLNELYECLRLLLWIK
ncbi:MAG: hypothetical protein N3A38_07645, partial [Planctomycetota bacterium]|nr:hypothetical protein [Planctomycetota bacterium]